MTTLQLPNDLVNGTNADATPVEQNFNLIQSHVNNELVNRDGSVAMTAPLLLAGDPTQANHAATKDYVDSVLPVGIIMPWPGKVAPAGDWMVCDGRSLAQSSYPDLYGVLGQSYGGGTGTFLLPNLIGRTVFGIDPARTEMSAVGKSGGTHVVPTPQHAHAMAHTHTMTHDHGAFNSGANTTDHTHAFSDTSSTTSAAGAHDHDFSWVQDLPHPGGDGARIVGYVGSGLHAKISSVAAHTHTVAVSGTTGANTTDHVHSINVPSFTGNTGGVSTPNTSNAGTAGAEMTPPFVAMLYIIRVK